MVKPSRNAAASLLRGAITVALAAASGAAAADSAEAVFVRGEVSAVQPDGTKRRLSVGDAVAPGQVLEAGAQGYAHLRFPDGGFVGVRPGTRFVVEHYSTEPGAPEGVRVRYRLDGGSMRAITGTAIERNRDRFRLNTPVVAIGVRGTDYVVQASDGLTRASVNSGAIVMAPLGGECNIAGLGACSTPAARTLTADMRGSYIEYRAGSQAPEIKKAVIPGLPPSAPDEPAGAPAKRAENGAGTVDTAATATADRVISELPPPPPMEVVWGRWSSLAIEGTAVPEHMARGYQPVFSNVVYGLLRRADPDLPQQGVVGFNLTGSSAQVRDASGQLTAAGVRDAALTVDFGARQFETRLSVSGAGLGSELSAAGKVDWQGTLVSDASRSTMSVLGLLAGPQARDAGYLFERALGSGSVLFGATTWRR